MKGLTSLQDPRGARDRRLAIVAAQKEQGQDEEPQAEHSEKTNEAEVS